MQLPSAPWDWGLCLFSFLVLVHLAVANKTLSSLQASRTPRVTGRIVKLYSHPHQEGFRCTSEGFHPDSDNCAAFYRCLESNNGKFTTFKFQCGPGTIFDKETGVCNFPSSTRRVECGGNKNLPASNTERVNENEIDSNDSEQAPPSPITTKNPVEFLTAILETTTDLDRWSSLKEIRPKLAATTTTTVATTQSKSTTKRSSSEDNGCMSSGFMGDSENCRMFYRCVANGRGGYIRYEFSCSESTVWDENIQACNHAWAAKSQRCGRSEVGSEKDKGTKEASKQKITNSQSQIQSDLRPIHSQTQTQIHYGDRVKQQQHQLNNGLHSAPNNTKISRGSGTSQVTALTTTFRTTQAETLRTTEEIDENNQGYGEQPAKQPGEQNTQTTITENIKPPVTKDNQCTSSGFIGDSEDCKKFYRCVDNGRGSYIRYEFACGEGTVWDSNLEACNHAWAVKDCGGRNVGDKIDKTTKAETTTSSTTTFKYTQPQTSTTIEEIDENDQGYGGQPIEQPAQQNKPPSTAPAKEITKPTSQKDNKCTSSGFMGDSEDCKKFYRCVDNGRGSYTRYEFSCGEGTVWDANLEACNHAWAVKECGGNKKEDVNKVDETTTSITTLKTTQGQPAATTEDIDENDQGYGEQLTKKPEEQSQPSSTGAPTQSTIPTSNMDNKCSNSGFMGDTEDCKKFYRCVDNGKGSYTRYEFSCGEGTVWDANLEACNHEWAVKECGGNNKEDSNKLDQTTKSETTTTSKTSPPTSTDEPQDDENQGYGPQTQNYDNSTTTLITTEKSDNINKNNQCKSSGFIGDTKDCKIFYRCVDNGRGSYTRYEFSCGEGTVWDANLEACNHAWAVKDCGGNYIEEVNKVEQTTKGEPTTTIITTSRPSTNQYLDDEDQGYGQAGQNDDTPTTKVTTTEKSDGSSNNNNQCTSSGFMGDNKDCKKFYRCVDNGKDGFIKYEFSCGEGTVWDSDIDACNHEDSVKKPCNAGESHDGKQTTESQTTSKSTTTEFVSSSKPVTQTEENESETTTKGETKPIIACNGDGFIGDEYDCKKFYRCVDNGNGGYKKYEFSCGDGTVWDQDIQACNHKSMVKSCGATSGSTTSTTEKEPNNEYGPEPENDELQPEQTSRPNQQQIETTTDSMKSPHNDDKCMEEGFYPDSNDCKKFHRCIDNGRGGYTKYEFTCGEGTVWDQEIQGCNHPTEGNVCRTGSSQEVKPESETTTGAQKDSSSTSKPEESEQTDKQEQTTTPALPSNPSESRGKCTSEGFHADENDCKKFYRCVDNGKDSYTKYDFTCGEGTAWDQEIQACNFESSVKSCSQGSSESADTATTTKRADTSESQSTEKMEDEYVTNEAENEYTSKPASSGNSGDGNGSRPCTSEGFHSHESNCKKFYRCVDNGKGGYTRYDFECGEGTAWDQEGQTCNYEDQVSCLDSSETNEESKPSSPHPNDEQQESATSEQSSQSTSESSSTSKQPSSSAKCDQEGYFGNSDDCKKFYRCVDNGKGGFTKYDFDCGEGTIWDQDLKTCNHPGDVQNPSCNEKEGGSQSSTTSSSEQSTKQPSTTSSEPNSQESGNQQTSSTAQSGITSKPASSNFTCPEAGFYANPDDCKKFYRCVDYEGDGKSYTVFHFDCGEGTIWDPNLDTCNYEDSIYPPRDCSKQTQGQEIQSETTTSTSTESESTTTQKSTTQKQTTESTTNKQQETTTDQQATTQKSTTQEQTTTESTTSKQQETTTEQQTTTHKSTTQEETTTQQTETTQQSSTTQKSTTAEEATTTQQSTTTQESTTEKETTTQTQTETQQETTTQQQTTTTQQETTTQDQSETTQSETTTSQTTQQQTTESQTTQQQTTESQTTQQQTTESQTTQQQTTESQTTTEQGTTQDESESTQKEQDDKTTEAQQTTTESTDEPDSTESASSNKECPETEDDQYLYVCPTGFKRHPKYCNLFYQCTEDNNNHDVKVAVFHCPNNTIYDDSKTQCVEESEADKKCDGEKAERRRFKRLDDNSKPPISVDNGRLSCPAQGHFPFDKNDECSPAFLKCQRKSSAHKMRGFIYRCPEGYVYWAVSRRCERSSLMKGCRGTQNIWKGRWEIPVEKGNVAP